MYHVIHQMHREGHSISYIANYLVVNWRTVKKYLSMSEGEYEAFIDAQSSRKKELSDYELFVKDRLSLYPSTSAAQMHDWLKEHYTDFPNANPKTVYNFVMSIRQAYNIPKVKNEREYFIVEELPYGKQAQVDFGEYNSRTSKGQRKKVYFFTIVLSRSRYKFVYFTDVPFTSSIAIKAHEKAFEYFDGIPKEIVYDQDKVFMGNENAGDLILVDKFQRYINQREFGIYFCRKADPETKGKVENVVKYVKQNFLYNRTFYDIETLNTEVIAWLGRTGNRMPHGTTKQFPFQEWNKEKQHLMRFEPITFNESRQNHYTLRPDNCISYKSNFYSVPQGTWKQPETIVLVSEDEGQVVICNLDGTEICRHRKSTQKGKKIINTDHKRDKAKRIDALIKEQAQCFDDQERAVAYLEKIRKAKPRYIRDQIAMIRGAFKQYDTRTLNQCLDYCLEHEICSSATDFLSVAETISKGQGDTPDKETSTQDIKILPQSASNLAEMEPCTSKILDYQQIMLN